nr:alpha/beta family hydrolase [uncultured Phenylobacterium sp.]
MLFLQGSHDALAELDLLQQTVAAIGDRATLYLIADADHAFHVPARTGRKDADELASALETAARWMGRCARADS